jgi:hypothetical protein
MYHFQDKTAGGFPETKAAILSHVVQLKHVLC